MTTYQNSTPQRLPDGGLIGAWWAPSEQHDRIDCLLCPRKCSLKPGDRGFCFVRENRDGQMVLSTYGKSTGFCIDPIEKKPLNHFYPGTPVLSFGTAGCNLGCKFCQNWDISKSREVERLSAWAEPEAIARAAQRTGCTSVAFTYNDPVIWAEYAIDTARACRAIGIRTVAVTAGYICPEAREEFFAEMDAANVDLKAFTEEFYQKITYSHLQPVLETIEYLKHETNVWFELTNLVIPAANDSPGELRRMCDWVMQAVGDEVPLHFSGFHPDFRMLDRGATDPDTLRMAHGIAKQAGIKFPYVGNAHDVARQSTYCPNCGHLLIRRDWYQLSQYDIDAQGNCRRCGQAIPGRFGTHCGDWGGRRQPIRIEDYAEVISGTTCLSDATSHKSVPLDSEVPILPQLPKVTERASPRVEPTTLDQTSMEEFNMADSNSGTAAPAAVASRPAMPRLRIDALTPAQRSQVLDIAAGVIASTVTGQPTKVPSDVVEEFAKSIVTGAFVTLKRGEILRGCCGVMGQPMAAGPAVTQAARRTAKEDQRMAPISPCELPYLSMSVTLLGPFNTIAAKGSERAAAVRIGKHGLLIQRGQKSGLLLPSVATERGWDAPRFLQAVCAKAGLPDAAWESDDTTVATFDGETVSCNLSDRLPVNFPSQVSPPITVEQLSGYAQIAGQNIVAFLTGGTPSYVITHLPDMTVNALVLSMQWGSEGKPEEARQGSALQVSFRPGVPLQSTLYQMCQQAALMFHQQKFTGQLQLGLTVGYDPARHGFGAQADLEGVDPAKRAIVISDSRHCGFAYTPERSLEETREWLRKALPIGSRDASVHSIAVVSTMPGVTSISAPQPVAGSGTRPAAVAGKFYPAEDAARRALVEKFFSNEAPLGQSHPLAIMVPHAGLKYSGQVAANVWRCVARLDGRTLIIVSPKHTNQGVNWSVCPFERWQLSKTLSFVSDTVVARSIADKVSAIQLDAAAHQLEHGIEVQLPILEKLAPHAKLVGLALHGGNWPDIQEAAEQMAELIRSMDQPPLFVISSDMNHFAQEKENRRRDRLALDALATCDPKQLLDTCTKHEISMCGLIPAAFVMETLKRAGHAFSVTEVDYATSADVSGDKSRVVGYAGALFLPETA